MYPLGQYVQIPIPCVDVSEVILAKYPSPCAMHLCFEIVDIGVADGDKNPVSHDDDWRPPRSERYNLVH
jgi:hypothetical protein